MKKYLQIVLLIFLISCQTQDERIYSIKEERQKEAYNKTQFYDSTKQTTKTTENVFLDTINSKQQITTDTVLLNKKIITRATYQANHINSLRRAIDLFNSNQSMNIFLTKLAFDGKVDAKYNIKIDPENTIYSFNQLYNEGYLSGKFILVNLSEEKDGNINLDVMFQHKQDKIFRFAMSYDKKLEIFVINAVFIPKKYDEQTVKFYRRLYSIYLNDDNFGV